MTLSGGDRPLKDPSGTVHHVIFILVTAYVLHNSIFKFPFTWLSLCEASTPFVNYRRALCARPLATIPLQQPHFILQNTFTSSNNKRCTDFTREGLCGVHQPPRVLMSSCSEPSCQGVVLLASSCPPPKSSRPPATHRWHLAVQGKKETRGVRRERRDALRQLLSHPRRCIRSGSGAFVDAAAILGGSRRALPQKVASLHMCRSQLVSRESAETFTSAKPLRCCLPHATCPACSLYGQPSIRP